MKWCRSESSILPLEVDNTISKNFIFVRRNITKVIRESEFADGEPQTFYEYDEAKFTQEEYEMYLKEISFKENAKQIESIKEENDVLIKQIETMKSENEIVMDQLNMLTDCILEISMLLYA